MPEKGSASGSYHIYIHKLWNIPTYNMLTPS